MRREGGATLPVAALLLGLYFVTRIGSLDVLPIFLDEAVHIQWAERLYGEGRILRPVGAGRLLAVAVYGLALPFDDRLFAARLLATLAGALTLILTMVLARRLFGHLAAWLAGLMYVLSPFALTYDRLALSDGFLAALITGTMVATRRIAEEPPARAFASFALVVTLALAVVAKVSALLFFFTIPLGVLALAKDRGAALKASAFACALGLLFASPMLWFFARNSGEIAAQHLVDPARAGSIVFATLKDMSGWALSYFTVPVLIAAALSLVLLRDRRAWWLGGSVAIPVLLFALLSEPWSARYILPTLPPLLILVAGGIARLSERLKPSAAAGAAFALVLITSIPSLSFDRHLLHDPARAPFPPDDRHQLVTGWPSGYGVSEIARRLVTETGGGPLTVFIDTGGARTVPTSLAILLAREATIRLVEGDFRSEAFRTSMAAEARSGDPSRRHLAILGPRPDGLDFVSLMEGVSVERIEVYQRPEGEWAATIFKLGVGSGPRD